MANRTEPENYTQCATFDGDVWKCNVILHLRRTIGSISLIGCVFVIAVIWLFRKYKIFSQRLFLYLSISVVIQCIFHISNDLHDAGHTCSFLAWAATICPWSVLLWACCITFNLHMNAVWMKSMEKYEWLYFVVAWAVPFVVSFVPFSGHHYGPAGAWCWIIDDWGWRFGIWYLPLMIIITMMIVVYTYTFFAINRKIKSWEGIYDPDTLRRKRILQEDVKPLRMYPFVYLACSIFPLIDRIQNAVSPDDVFGLKIMHALCTTLPGAINAVVFAFDKDTRNKLTWLQIKMAIQARFVRQTTLIHEYTVGNYQIPTVANQLPPDSFKMERFSTESGQDPKDVDTTEGATAVSDKEEDQGRSDTP